MDMSKTTKTNRSKNYVAGQEHASGKHVSPPTSICNKACANTGKED